MIGPQTETAQMLKCAFIGCQYRKKRFVVPVLVQMVGFSHNRLKRKLGRIDQIVVLVALH